MNRFSDVLKRLRPKAPSPQADSRTADDLFSQAPLDSGYEYDQVKLETLRPQLEQMGLELPEDPNDPAFDDLIRELTRRDRGMSIDVQGMRQPINNLADSPLLKEAQKNSNRANAVRELLDDKLYTYNDRGEKVINKGVIIGGVLLLALAAFPLMNLGKLEKTADAGSTLQGTTVRNTDGSTTTTYGDGTVVNTLSDGTEITRKANGEVATKTPDGVTTTSYPDGRKMVMQADGSSIETLPDGSTTRRDAKGDVIENTPPTSADINSPLSPDAATSPLNVLNSGSTAETPLGGGTGASTTVSSPDPASAAIDPITGLPDTGTPTAAVSPAASGTDSIFSGNGGSNSGAAQPVAALNPADYGDPYGNPDYASTNGGSLGAATGNVSSLPAGTSGSTAPATVSTLPVTTAGFAGNSAPVPVGSSVQLTRPASAEPSTLTFTPPVAAPDDLGAQSGAGLTPATPTTEATAAANTPGQRPPSPPAAAKDITFPSFGADSGVSAGSGNLPGTGAAGNLGAAATAGNGRPVSNVTILRASSTGASSGTLPTSAAPSSSENKSSSAVYQRPPPATTLTVRSGSTVSGAAPTGTPGVSNVIAYRRVAPTTANPASVASGSARTGAEVQAQNAAGSVPNNAAANAAAALAAGQGNLGSFASGPAGTGNAGAEADTNEVVSQIFGVGNPAETSSTPGNAAVPAKASPYKLGQRMMGTFETGVLVAQNNQTSLPVYASTADGTLWRGTVTLDATKRVNIIFDRAVLSTGEEISVEASAYNMDGTPGVKGRYRDIAPTLANDLIRSALGGVTDYVEAKIQATRTTTSSNGSTTVERQAPSIYESVAAGTARVFTLPPSQNTFVTVAEIPVGTTFAIVYGSVTNQQGR